MVGPGPAGVAWRRVTRAAVSSATKSATGGPVNTRHVNCLVATRPLCSLSSFSGDGSPRIAATVRVIQAPLATSLATALSRLTIQQNGGPRHPLSSLAQMPPPSGEPITYLSLNNLADNPGAVKKARRVGRGIGSSKGKTCGRGHKGQKARAGKGVHPTFEGGQTRFFKRLPKIGKMKNARFRLELIPLNLGKVQDYVTMGRLVPERGDGVLTMRDFVNAGMFPASSVKSGVKLLADGKKRLRDKLLIDVPWASAAAIKAVESKGGFVTTVHYNRLALRAHLKPHKFPLKPEVMLAQQGDGEGAAAAKLDVEDMHLLPKRARPPVKYMPYYTDYAKRGYLSPQVQLERRKRGLKEIH